MQLPEPEMAKMKAQKAKMTGNKAKQSLRIPKMELPGTEMEKESFTRRNVASPGAWGRAAKSSGFRAWTFDVLGDSALEVVHLARR